MNIYITQVTELANIYTAKLLALPYFACITIIVIYFILGGYISQKYRRETQLGITILWPIFLLGRTGRWIRGQENKWTIKVKKHFRKRKKKKLLQKKT